MNAHQSLAIGQSVETFEAISSAVAEPDAMVRFAGISKTYPAYRGKPGVNALQNIDFAIPRGSITGVIGRSGAGKSTLVRLINGLEKPTTGRVIVDDREISALAGSDLRLVQRSIGMIFQHFNLLSSRTAAANIALPLEIAGWAKADIKTRVAELLALVGIADKHDRYPSELSGGKQRVGIARALATRPSVLLSDEATSALDPQTTRAILDLLANINRELGVTIVLITHEMSVVRQLAKEVVVLDAGHVVESGHVADIFTHPRHPITQSFLAEVIGGSLPVSLASRIVQEPVAGNHAVIRVQVRGAGAGDTLIARLARELGLDVSLLSARIDEVGGQHVGSLVLGIPDGESAATRTLAWLSQYQFSAERLGYVA